MKKLMILPAMLFCSLLFANENNGKAKSKKETKLAAKQEKAAQKKIQQGNQQVEAAKGTPVVTYKSYKVERRSSKQIVPAE